MFFKLVLRKSSRIFIVKIEFFFFFSIRSIVWLQNQRDMALERNRGPSPRRDDPHEYRIGRLKHERVKVPRGEHLLEWAIQVLKVHAARKSILEVSIFLVFLYSSKEFYNIFLLCIFFSYQLWQFQDYCFAIFTLFHFIAFLKFKGIFKNNCILCWKIQ